jgi:cell division topological specificity factor
MQVRKETSEVLEFLTKFEFLNKIFKRGETRQSAKERLQLVLIHDRASVSPHMMESLKEDLIQIISKYLEIDVGELEIGLEQKDGSIALAANIPIKQVKRAADSPPSKTEPPKVTEVDKEKPLPAQSADREEKVSVPPGSKKRSAPRGRGKRKSKIRRFTEKKSTLDQPG